MKMEDQNVSEDLAREMKELGAEQDSVWIWMQSPRTTSFNIVLKATSGLLEDQGWKIFCPAYTVAELGELLPSQILCGVMPTPYYFSIGKCDYKGDTDWRVKYRNESIYDTFHFVNANTEADARAKMWIYLKQEGLL